MNKTVIMPYYGGKASICDWLISHFPYNYTKMHYVEPFAGSLAVFFKKKPSVLESISDLNKDIFNLFKVLRDNIDSFYHKVDNTLYNENDLIDVREILKNENSNSLDRAWAIYIAHHLSFSGVGTEVGFSYTLNVRPDSNSYLTQSRHKDIKNIIPFIKKRLRKTQIFNREADWFVDKLKENNNVFMYLDPPYPESDQRYKHKYTLDQFNSLLEKLYNVKFKFMLSFYEKESMNLKKFKEDKRFTFLYKDTICVSSGKTKKGKRTECILINYPTKNLVQDKLF